MFRISHQTFSGEFSGGVLVVWSQQPPSRVAAMVGPPNERLFITGLPIGITKEKCQEVSCGLEVLHRTVLGALVCMCILDVRRKSAK